jgi:hypothetical protein
VPADLHDQLDQAAPQRVPDLDFDRLWRRHRRARALRTVGGVTIAAMLAAVVLSITPRTPAVTIDPAGPPRDTHSDVIRKMVDALNARDTDAFIDVFAPDGAFNPRGDFHRSSSLFGNTQPVAQGHLVETWMAIIDAWGLEADLLACHAQDGPGRYAGGSVVACAVATRWHTLSMEIHEGWSFEFGDTGLLWWNSHIGTNVDGRRALELLNLDPRTRELPLGYDGLERWEAWLKANHPEDAARYLNPRQVPVCDGCDEFVDQLAPDDPARATRLAPLLFVAKNDWTINGHDFHPAGLIPYDPAFADEIETSIQTYLNQQ